MTVDLFCEECASGPAWPFDHEKVIQAVCQKCLRMSPCNDYGYKVNRGKIEPAPAPKDLVAHRPEKDLTIPDGRSEADKMLDAIQPNRPGIRLEPIKKPRKG